MTFRNQILKAHPATLVLASFLVVIAAGTSLLILPLSTASGHIHWVDALFTAASAVCVTGLTVLDTGSYFTTFGQCVILVMIQVGGLGLMTISVGFFRWIGRGISIRQRMAMQDLFTHTPRADILGLVKSTILFTLAAEAMGAALLTIHWAGELPFPGALYMAVFHSVSAFCNAGFALFPDSFMRYRGDALLNTAVGGLIVVGGIGFPVLYDLRSWFVRRRKERVRLAIQTKTVLLTTLVLIASGALMFAFLERQAAGGQSLPQRILVSVFQSVTCRTAGFNTVDIPSLHEATLAVMIFLMFFGASPGSCGGGVKTTTLALLAASVLSWIRRKRRIDMFKKSIPYETVNRSVTLILVSVGIIGLIVFLLLAGDAESGRAANGTKGSFLPYLFETVSAFGTVGLSMGVTSELTAWGKSCIILTMIIGRVGVLTFSYVILGVGTRNGIEYSEENLMIG